MSEGKFTKADLLKIKHSDEINNKVNELDKLNKTLKKQVLEDDSTGKSYKEKIDEANKKYNFGLLNILILPGLIQWVLNKSKENDLEELRKEVKEKTNALVEGITQTLYVDSKLKDEIRMDEMKDKYNECAGRVINEFMDKKCDNILEQLRNGSIGVDQVKSVILKELEDINPTRNNNNIAVNDFDVNKCNKVNEIDKKPNAAAIINTKEDFTDKKFENKDKLASAIKGKLKEGKQVDITKEQARILSIDVSKEDTGLKVPVGGISKPIKCKQNGTGFTLGTTW